VVPDVVRRDLDAFLGQVEPELTPELLKQTGIRATAPAEVIQALRSAYEIGMDA